MSLERRRQPGIETVPQESDQEPTTSFVEDVQIPDSPETLRPTAADEAAAAAHRNRIMIPTEQEAREAKKRSRRNFLIAGTAVVGTFLVGGIIGAKTLGASNESPEPRPEPVATAPLTPGQTERPEPRPSTAAETDPRKWTAENVPLTMDINGDGTYETYTGIEQLKGALEIKASDYDTPEEAAEAFIDRVNLWMSWTQSKELVEKYWDYETPDMQRIGVGGIAHEFGDPAFVEALTSSPKNGEQVITGSVDKWVELQNSISGQNHGRWARSVKDPNLKPYLFEYSLDAQHKGEDAVYVQHHNPNTKTASISLFLKYDDNAEAARELPANRGYTMWNIALQQQEGEGGEKVWKMIGFQAMPYQPSR